MSTNSKTTFRASSHGAALALAAIIVCMLFPQVSRADDTYSIGVIYHRYDGHKGHDEHGGNLYRVKVQHGHHFYFIYLHQPLPQLRGHMHEKIPVVVSSETDRWLTLSIHGNSARVHKVVEIEHK